MSASEQSGPGEAQKVPSDNRTQSIPISIETQLEKSRRDLESMVIKYATSERENLQNKSKVDELDRKLKRAIKDNESLANRIKLLQNDKNQLLDTLNAKVAQLTVLEQKNASLNSTQTERLKEAEEELDRLRKVNEDLTKQIETYKSKEGELLDFSERLSMKHMLLQTELQNVLNEKPDLRLEHERLVGERDELAKQNESLSEELRQCKVLNASLRAEAAEIDLKHRRHLDELENEIKVMRRKHQMATKELLRQLKQLQPDASGAVDWAHKQKNSTLSG